MQAMAPRSIACWQMAATLALAYPCPRSSGGVYTAPTRTTYAAVLPQPQEAALVQPPVDHSPGVPRRLVGYRLGSERVEPGDQQLAVVPVRLPQLPGHAAGLCYGIEPVHASGQPFPGCPAGGLGEPPGKRAGR